MTLDSVRPSEPPRETPAVALATDRFQVVRELGKGGMATVYEVVDRSTGKHLALKRMHPEPDVKRYRRLLELFEREFYTLSQLAHPGIVEVYDYGVDERGAYYTMELLEGGELQKLVPLPFAQVCRIGREVCSALSLLHSRRLVYRDLNPRNVHCTADGSAKLIDFGATADMGPSRQVVGTPAYCAPEALDLQPLDARTDLYSLGATLYFALTACHAYPAKTFAQLRDAWSVRPLPPSQLTASVPPALDALVMDLLHADPAVRHANAAEVIERLAAIEGRPADEQVQVTQAYLTTPNIVGRDAALARVRAKLQRTVRSDGSALLFTGGSGVGRTRLLAACLLEAKLQGVLALRADATDGDDDYGVTRALATSLLESAPELALRCAGPKLSYLGHAVPQLLDGRSDVPLAAFDRESQQRAQILAALREWFVAVASQRPLLLAVDDLHEIDEPSAALLALCAHATANAALAVIATCETDANTSAPSALRLFSTAAASVTLANLCAPDTERLLRSVFGDVPQVQLVAHRVHAISHGNPRDTLQLAQYLVDRGLARYRSGAWTLAATFDDSDLPANMAQALRAQLDTLAPYARELACLISLANDRDVAFDELIALYADLAPKQIHDGLNELVATQVLERTGDRYRVTHAGFHAVLRRMFSDADRRRMHRLLAQLFARRGNEEFRRALHLFRAGESESGLDVLVAYAQHSQALTDSKPVEYLKLVQSMPDKWFEVYTRAITRSVELDRPALQLFTLRNRLAGLVNVMGAPSTLSHPQVIALVRQLARDSGLEDYVLLDSSLPAGERLLRAISTAKERREASPERDRGLDPISAVKHLVRLQVSAAGMAAMALDYEFWSQLPSLAPFAAINASVNVIDQLIAGVGARIGGRQEHAYALYQKVIERTSQPDRAGLDVVNHRFLRFGVMFAMGLIEASMGLASCLGWASQIEGEPLHLVNACHIRILHELWQGRVRDADRLRERVELLRIESSPRQLLDGMHLIMQVVAHAFSDDLTRLKHALDEIRALSDRHPAWHHITQYASGEYQRIRGDYAAAAAQLRAAVTGLRAGTHQIWPFAAAAYVHVLCLLGRFDEAARLGAEWLATAEAAGLGCATHFIRMPLALAKAEQGQLSQAAELADSVIASFRDKGSTGLCLVVAYETRARVAIHADDSDEYETYAALCAEQCRAAGSRVLGAKYERLVRAATSATVHVSDAAPAPVFATLSGTQLTSVLVGCNQPSERAQRALELLLKRSGVDAGFLFLIGDHGPELAARAGPNQPPLPLPGIIAEFIDAELEDRAMNTRSLEAEDAEDAEDAASTKSSWASQTGEQHRLVLLGHQMTEGFAITGVATLVVPPGANFAHPGSLAKHLSKLMFDAGDVTPILSD